MKRLKQKLNSRRGASILLALLSMLVATMVAVVVVSASVTAVNRVSDDSDRQQGLLSVTAAARLIEESLAETITEVEDATCAKIVTTEYYYDPVTDEEGKVIRVDTKPYPSTTEWYPGDGTGFFGVFLRKIAEKADSGADVTGNYDLLITPPDGTSLSAAIFHFTLITDGDDFKMDDPVVYLADAAGGFNIDKSENKVWLDDIAIDHDSKSEYFDLRDEEIDFWKVGSVRLMTQKLEG